MSNRNFDSRVIIQRLQALASANNTYNYNTNGRRIINNPQNSLPSFGRIADLDTGRETTYQQSLRGTYTSSTSGILNIVIANLPQPTPPAPAPIVTEDLIIHFEANDPASYPGTGLTWTNIGTGAPLYDGTLSGAVLPVFTPSPIPTFTFTRNFLGDGTDYLNYNYIAVDRPPTIGDDFTFCAWIKTTDVGAGADHYQLMYIVSTETGGVSNDYGFGVNDSGQLAYGDGGGGGDITVSTTETVNTGQWTFVCVTRQKSNGEVNLYIDGVLKQTGTCNVGNTLGDSPIMYIGTETDFPGYTWGGGIAAFLANTSVLTPAQILQNYNAQKANYGY